MLRKGANKLGNQTNLDACLLLGARYIECYSIQNNPDWFGEGFVTIPEERKVKRTQKYRWIRLSDKGKSIIPYFLDNNVKLPEKPQAWRMSLIRWAEAGGLDPVGISPRTLRKTWESWLAVCFGEYIHIIAESQGHTAVTAFKHYQNTPFSDDDIRDMKVWVSGWNPRKVDV